MGGKDLRIAKSLPFKSAPKPALARPLHGHLLNLLFNGDLNLSGLCYRFDEPPSGALQKRALSCGKGLRIAKSLPFKSAPKPALARPSSWPLAKSSLQWRFKP